ncbi:hypothetical protein [uncultured Martelella sp.]|uniref:hypothetical protein n=1 Tax=uncultured Martelella sp. TaxID=392331 RepID=UPI00374927F6
MDIRRMKVWLLGTKADNPLPFDPQHARPDCLCLHAKGEERLSERIASLRSLLPSLPIFLICEPISQAYNIDDFSRAARAAPDGIILRGVESAARIQMAETLLRVVEAREDLDEGAIALIAMIGDNGGGLLNARHFLHRHGRLIALGYDGDALDHGDGAIARHGAVATMLAARNLGIPAIDFSATRSPAEAFETSCHQAARTGFAGKLTENPEHIGIIKSAFGTA